jgi:hypothetical protein
LPEGFWLGLTVGILSTVIGGLILAGVLYLVRLYWRDDPIRRYVRERRAAEEDKRLLWAFREISRDDIRAALLIEKAAKRAQIEDPSASVNRLKSKGLIIPFGPPDYRPEYVQITLDGLRAAPPPSTERRSWWRRMFGSD